MDLCSKYFSDDPKNNLNKRQQGKYENVLKPRNNGENIIWYNGAKLESI